MYLKSLTVRGFKSFASATSFDFEPGITAVVGPNGSGKSNVVDALAWVMGEQGAKTLRGGSMEDVIFAGTSSRQALGRAHVTLTIDNSDGALPIEYTEVTISRTLFRSGGSEYAINGSPVRLLDIQELLSDSGLGREMHVIVGQGQLDKILRASAEERRGFIEEAAGILKHRRRKEKTLRKLDSTQANLNRLEDLVKEIARQLKPLGRQADTARRARSVQARLRDAKSRLLADDVVALMNEAESAAARKADLDEAQKQARESVDAAGRLVSEAEVGASKAVPAAASARETWYELSQLSERYAGLLRVAEERQRLLGQPLERSNVGEDPDVLEQRAQATDAEADEADAAVVSAREALDTAGAERVEAEAKQQAENDRLTALLRAVADRREGLARLAGQVGTARQRLESAVGERERAVEARDAAQARSAEAKGHMDEAQAAADEAREATVEPLARVPEAQKALDEAKAALQSARDALNTARQRRAGLEARVAVLAETTQSQAGAGALLEGHEDALLDVLSDRLTVEPGFEAAVKAALQGADEGLVAVAAVTLEQIADASAAGTEGSVTLLHTVGEHRAVSLPSGVRSVVDVVGTKPGDERLVQALLGSVALVDTDAEARRVVSESGCIAVTVAGHRWSRAGVVIGAGDGAGALARVRSLEIAREELAEAEVVCESAEAEVERAQPVVQKAQTELATAQEAARQATDASRTAASRVERLTSLAAQADADVERHADAYVAADAAVDKARVALAELNDRLTVAQDVPEEAEPSTAERDRLAEAASQAREAETQARLAVREAEELARKLRDRAHSQRRAARAERAAREEAQRRAARRAAQAKKAETVAQRVRTAQGLLARSVEAAQVRVEEAEEAVRRCNAQLETARGSLAKAQARLSELRDESHKTEIDQAERQARYEALEEKALSEVSMTPDHLVEHFGPHLPVPSDFSDSSDPWAELRQEVDEDGNPVDGEPFDREVQLKRLKQAERDLQALGKVNPLALEEFAALEERHQYLVGQVQDLTNTRAELLKLIDEVDQHVQTVFADAFADTAKEFTAIFSRLFPGGEGKLTLTDPSDMLTTGIEVEARPAGKKVKRLSLLSGGERSLTALAMLIAIFKARPSPFYVMDEVEAALDERNLLRLLEVFKDLQEASQLIIITHQKHTMDIADALYGVSMRGDGVSHVVSQRIAAGGMDSADTA
ncbi:chromosome segregation protein SMC [Pseudoglutamicibacter cumminsii]|uniref:Chromosome partition protein Smc n=1 Tax=Pseudoglutamicibacter cumminsii TaxID=156979 RepID=A0ABX5L583_9MICC|nr:chromosome segregation protein SMC [Pseudoglutamicibacter cumminsii]PWI27299.1 chromosome segregation protein SMC [Pseudoglutamicibacter cumminsii]